MESTQLIFAPHQDDEVLMCAGVLERSARQGVCSYVCVLTNGEYEEEPIAAARVRESTQVLGSLGVPESRIFFLGYPDTGMPWEQSFLMRIYREEDPERVFPSHWGRTETWLPSGDEYHWKRFGRHAPYCRRSVLKDLTGILEEARPQVIYLPAVCDHHGDHAATPLLVAEALGDLRKSDRNYLPRLLQFLVHSVDDLAWPNREQTGAGGLFHPPSDLEALGLDWENRVRLPVPEGMGGPSGRKHRLIQRYQSQKPELYNKFLLAFAKDEEIFFPLEWEALSVKHR